MKTKKCAERGTLVLLCLCARQARWLLSRFTTPEEERSLLRDAQALPPPVLPDPDVCVCTPRTGHAGTLGCAGSGAQLRLGRHVEASNLNRVRFLGPAFSS